MSEMESCGVCHALHPMEELACFNDTLVCPDCLEDSTVICNRCGDRLWSEDDQGDDVSGHLCQTCYDRYYNTCDECHTVIPEADAYYEDDDRVLCHDCHIRRRSQYSINDYSYKPVPIFYGSDTLYMGVEIELDEGGESDNQARKLLEIANSETERIYCKHDGSLNDGFEVVSHPMTLEYHMKSMPWAAVLDKAKQLDYRSHQAKTCGLHVHVNRTAFGDNIADQEAVIARILYFFEKHWEELLKVSRRSHRQMEQWANRYGYKDSPMEILDHAKKGFRGFRYTAVNLTNANTIEFRLFRGTLRYNSFIAALQLIDRICAVAICLNDDELKQMSWSTFVAGCGHYPELVQYLKERRLYINEPVTAEAEVVSMCCLFGILDYGGKLSRKEKTKILSVLSVACEERGTDATGIAYNTGGSLKVYKHPLPAHLLWFRIFKDTNVVMGHTRMTTQGSERFNANNHPFAGQAGDTTFALAHNGVLSNDKRLRRQHDLPATKIETDSYIAVQLLEASGELSFASLASMAEKLEGSFTITVMTDQDELYFIKGDNPMCIYHYEKLGFYIYASTEPILKTALKQLNLKLGKPTKIKLDCGEILRIDANGSMSRSQFDDTNIFMGYTHWPRWPVQPECWKPATNDSYINDLKSIAAYYGIYEDEIDEMLADGVTPDEIEELLNGA